MFGGKEMGGERTIRDIEEGEKIGEKTLWEREMDVDGVQDKKKK